MAVDFKKFFLTSRRFWLLGAGLVVHALVIFEVIPEASEGMVNEKVATIIAMVLDLVGTFFAFVGGPALTVSPSGKVPDETNKKS